VGTHDGVGKVIHTPKRFPQGLEDVAFPSGRGSRGFFNSLILNILLALIEK
jgi:hypothetical protein